MHLSFVNPSRTLAALALLAPLGLTQERSIKPYLPASTVMVVSLPDIDATLEKVTQMPLAKMWAEAEVQDFLADIIKMVHEGWEQALEQAHAAAEMGIPVNPDDLMKLRIDGLTFALTRLDLAMGPAGPMPEIGIMVHLDFGESAPIWNGLIDMGLGMAMQSAAGMVSMETSEVGDITLTTLAPEGLQGWEGSLNIAKVGTGIVFGTIKDEIVSMLESMNDGEPVLTASDTYRAAFEHIERARAEDYRIRVEDPGDSEYRRGEEVDRDAFRRTNERLAADDEEEATGSRVTGSPEAETYVRLEPLVDFGIAALAMAAEMQPDFPEIDIAGVGRALDMLGLSGIEAVAAACEYQGSVNVTRSYVVSPENRRSGLLAVTGEELDLDFLPWVPRDAVSFSASRIDVAGIYDSIIKAVQAYDAEMAEMVLGQLAAIEGEIGLSLRDDLFGAFGEKLITWSMPVGGAIGAAPEIAMLVEVENQEGLLKSLNIISQLSQGALEIETVERRGITAHQIALNMDLGAGPMVNPLANYRPTFAFKDGFMVMGFSAGDVRRAFDRMDREPDPEGDIRGNQEFEPYLRRIPREGLMSLSFTDWKASFEGVYQMLTAVLAFIPVTDDVPLDFALLPDSLTLTQHLSGGISYSVADDNGFLSTSVSPFGPEIVAVSAAAGALAAVLYSGW